MCTSTAWDHAKIITRTTQIKTRARLHCTEEMFRETNIHGDISFSSTLLLLSHRSLVNCITVSYFPEVLVTWAFLKIKTERRGRVVNTPASYSSGPVFDSRSRRQAILIEVFRGFPQSL
jgi:hypothetical protein